MLSAANLPACSVTSFVAAMALLSGVVSLATSAAYKGNVQLLRKDGMVYLWVEVGQVHSVVLRVIC